MALVVPQAGALRQACNTCWNLVVLEPLPLACVPTWRRKAAGSGFKAAMAAIGFMVLPSPLGAVFSPRGGFILPEGWLLAQTGELFLQTPFPWSVFPPSPARPAAWLGATGLLPGAAPKHR